MNLYQLIQYGLVHYGCIYSSPSRQPPYPSPRPYRILSGGLPVQIPTRLCPGHTEFYSEDSQRGDWNYRRGFAPLSSRKKETRLCPGLTKFIRRTSSVETGIIIVGWNSPTMHQQRLCLLTYGALPRSCRILFGGLPAQRLELSLRLRPPIQPQWVLSCRRICTTTVAIRGFAPVRLCPASSYKKKEWGFASSSPNLSGALPAQRLELSLSAGKHDNALTEGLPPYLRGFAPDSQRRDWNYRWGFAPHIQSQWVLLFVGEFTRQQIPIEASPHV